MESAIIKTNGFFPLDIVYSRVLLNHLDSAVRGHPSHTMNPSSGKSYATEYGLGYSCIPRLRRSSRMFLAAGARTAGAAPAGPAAAGGVPVAGPAIFQ
jgi:hypothetical protein